MSYDIQDEPQHSNDPERITGICRRHNDTVPCIGCELEKDAVAQQTRKEAHRVRETKRQKPMFIRSAFRPIGRKH
jgi:hypothetical protein